MNNAPWVPPKLQCSYIVWVAPLILTSYLINTSQLDFKCFTVYYIFVGCITLPVHFMISYWPEKLGCHGNLTLHPEFHCMNQPHLHKLQQMILYWDSPPLICTSCITNTVFHPSFVHASCITILCSTPHLHKLRNKWQCTEFHHPSSAQVA